MVGMQNASYIGFDMSIILKNVSLEFPIYNVKSLSLRNTIVDKLGGILKTTKKSIQLVKSLSDISLEIHAGDRVALIGHNGAGKSTLLRLMAGIYAPTVGSVDVTGSISTLFSAGVCLNDEMTGYENLLLGAILYNKNYKVAKEKVQELAEFTDLGNYLGFPMRTYSDGMKVRIGFSIATSITPDILLIDEVFGAGDKDFAEKANARMNQLIEKSKTLVFASHSDGLLRMFCNKGILMSKGKVLEYDDLEKVLATYNKIAA